MAFDPANYNWPAGTEDHLPPPCYGDDLNNEDERKFDLLAIHLIQSKLDANNIPFRVCQMMAHYGRPRSRNRCHWMVMLRHQTNPNFNYRDAVFAGRIRNDIQGNSPGNIHTIYFTSSIRDLLVEANFEAQQLSTEAYLYLLRCKCLHNLSTVGEYQATFTKWQLPHVREVVNEDDGHVHDDVGGDNPQDDEGPDNPEDDDGGDNNEGDDNEEDGDEGDDQEEEDHDEGDASEDDDQGDDDHHDGDGGQRHHAGRYFLRRCAARENRDTK